MLQTLIYLHKVMRKALILGSGTPARIRKIDLKIDYSCLGKFKYVISSKTKLKSTYLEILNLSNFNFTHKKTTQILKFIRGQYDKTNL